MTMLPDDPDLRPPPWPLPADIAAELLKATEQLCPDDEEHAVLFGHPPTRRSARRMKDIDASQQIPGLAVTNPTALREWMNSEEHSYRCTAWSEGQLCCLDRLLEANEANHDTP